MNEQDGRIYQAGVGMLMIGVGCYIPILGLILVPLGLMFIFKD